MARRSNAAQRDASAARRREGIHSQPLSRPSAPVWDQSPIYAAGRLWCCAPRARSYRPNVRTNRGMVLVVDDDASVRKALRRLFHATGRNVETFASAAEFLAYDLPPEAGCLVLDIRMPGISGLDLQKQLAMRNPDLPVVVITGHGDDEVRQRALEGGAIAILDKPFDDQSLLDAVELAMGRKRSS